jgi:hypothetical protein
VRNFVHGSREQPLSTLLRARVGEARPPRTRLAPVLLPRLGMRARSRRRGPGEAGLTLGIALFTLMGFLAGTAPSTRVAGVDIVATLLVR